MNVENNQYSTNRALAAKTAAAPALKAEPKTAPAAAPEPAFKKDYALAQIAALPTPRKLAAEPKASEPAAAKEVEILVQPKVQVKALPLTAKAVAAPSIVTLPAFTAPVKATAAPVYALPKVPASAVVYDSRLGGGYVGSFAALSGPPFSTGIVPTYGPQVTPDYGYPRAVYGLY